MKSLLFCLMLGITSKLPAQLPVPDYGVINDDEKNLTECPFDKEADAVIIFDKASADHNENYSLVTTRRKRIKILKQKGIEQGNIEILYQSKDDFEYLTDIKASVYNIDNGIVKSQSIPQSAIFRQKANSYFSQAKFALPDVRVGSIIEYEYTSIRKYYSLEDWEFQSELPTMLSSYALVILPNYEFQYIIHKSASLPITVKPDKTNGRILFEMTNIGGLRDEPYMDAKRDYIQRVEFQMSAYQTRTGDKSRYMTTWSELTKELVINSDFGGQLNKNISGAGDLINKAKAIPSAYDKMTLIYNEVQRIIDWNGINSRYAVDGVKNVWEKKKGTKTEINLLLINLLSEAGLEVYPLLVSERSHGKVNPEFAIHDQFNLVMAYVLIDNKKYILDASGPYTPPFLIPFNVVNTTAFVVNRKKGGIVSLSETEKKFKNQVIINGMIDENGALSGNATILSSDYARINRRRAWANDKENYKERYYTASNATLIVDSLAVDNLDNDSLPFEQKFHFEAPPVTSGNYNLVSLNLFSGFEKNPFIADNRFTNIDFGCLQENTISAWIKVPPGMQPESLPKDIKLIMPDTSITMIRYMRYQENVLTVRYQVQIKRTVFSAEEYGYVREFYKRMIDMMNEQVVLRKKS